MPKPLVSIKKLLKTRLEGRGYELYIPSLQIRQGEFWALMGQSGSGKSTALDILALILRPDNCQEFSLNTQSGQKLLSDSTSLNLTQNSQTHFNAAKAWAGGNLDSLANIRAKHFGYVLQIGGLLPFLNVRDNIMLSRKTANLKGEGPVPELVNELGISHLLNKKINQISVGERQRVAIARALAHEPSLVLADEPTSALDPVTAADVLNLLISLTRQQQAALLVASHDWHAVRRAGFKELHITVDMGKPKHEELINENKHAQQSNPIRAILQNALQEKENHDSNTLLGDKSPNMSSTSPNKPPAKPPSKPSDKPSNRPNETPENTTNKNFTGNEGEK